ncbi:AAA family ATPase [Merismopedia glauca]|uniref:Nuclease SbcCD subunit C n=1 Tax=Merismopedia glauca CCAP 1448/3 TaxID=1296344 RepID=A0A2T1C2M2_9CYAN|nr:AAA family ATPase [Merismopedia glauca]PSB02520.1 ATP-binding protein [Merismopedia glauca CCAP 1448/3]
MKLIGIRLCNFRQFYGATPEIKIAGDIERNITVIHGNNGSGKTSLLNAFTWVLYEKFTAAFASVEQLVNKRAIAEANLNSSIECWVEVTWEHDNKRYLARRFCRAYKTETDYEVGKTQLSLYFAADDGKWIITDKHQDEIIGEILPNSLHQYFFFDGERIEQIVRSDKKAEIAEAMKMLLGIEILNRSIRHLGEAKKSLDLELKQIGDSQIKGLMRSQNQSQIELDKKQTRQQEIIQEIEHQQLIKHEVSKTLLDLSAAQEIQNRREQLESQKALNLEQLKKSQQALKRLISSKAYTVLLPEITSSFRNLIADLRQKGELKAGISQEFVKEILERQRCFCGTELEPGSYTYQQVEAWIDKAGIAGVEETAIRMLSQVDEIDKQAISFWEEADREQANISQLRQVISDIENQLDLIHEKLRKDPSEEIRNLQKRLDDIELKIKDLTLEQGANQQKIADTNTELANLIKQIARQELNETKQKLAQRRIIATQDAIERLTEVKHRQEQNFRLQLESRVQEIFAQISFTPYIPKITEKYELILVENTSGVESIVAASTGENQILSLSFISSIIDKVREWSESKTLMMPDSSTFPIVMDSPFGSLDEIYRRQVAKIVPRLANQLVVLVSKTQWRGEVQAEISHKTGKQYVLVYYSPKPDCEADSIELDGIDYPLVKQSPNDFEYTEILEVD